MRFFSDLVPTYKCSQLWDLYNPVRTPGRDLRHNYFYMGSVHRRAEKFLTLLNRLISKQEID